MANRPVFVPRIEGNEVGVETRNTEFQWFPGMAKSQKQKSVLSLHEASGFDKVLEISSKSELSLGIALSAFNLMIKTPKGRSFSLENAFQSSKVFELDGPFIDLLSVTPLEAKRDERLKNSGKMIAFRFFDKEFPLEPKTLFYDWLYVNALYQNPDLANQVVQYQAFTDIEFNPEKSFSCQAFSAALYCSLFKAQKLEQALTSMDSFLDITESVYAESELNRAQRGGNKPKVQQEELF